ncbi:MAG: DUF1801 domain-containing protein [Spirochaetaceae bacterium]|jgi:uncharacterized protein YdhG (YjbR/CyaY superfamily)|nr:DUF1801 domain-containing protein [Spirochaetaceae bacterium]
MTKSQTITVDEYIAKQSPDMQRVLQKLRELICAELPPEASEKISYGMPTFYLKQNLIHYAAFKDHIGIFPQPQCIDAIPEAAPYRSGKGTLRFESDRELPWDLIKKLVQQRLQETAVPL